MSLILILIIFLLSVFTLFFVIYKYLSWNFDYWKKRNVSGPAPKFWNGTFSKTYAGECDLVEELDEYYIEHKGSHKYIGVFTGRKPKLFVLDPDLAKEILTTRFKDFHNNESSKWTTAIRDPVRHQSPFVCTDDDWKEKRAELSPVLTSARLRDFHLRLQESAEKLVAYIRRHLREPMDIKELIKRYNADFLSRYIWGIQTHTDAFAEGTISELHRMGNSMINQAVQCVRYYERTVDFQWLRQILPKRFFPKISDNFFLGLANYVLAMGRPNAVDQGIVMNHLSQLRDKKSLNDVQIAGHTTTVTIDGFETGAVVTAHLLLYLARYPHVQEKLREELRRVDEKCSYEELNSLQYLDQCLNETLRLFPPLALLVKLSTSNAKLEDRNGESLQLQTGTSVYISAYSFHRDGDYYDQPEEFIPERFNSELGGVRKYRDMGVFLPFGDGPRTCPGIKLGTYEVKMAAFAIVRHFTIHPGPRTRRDNKIDGKTFLATIKDGVELFFEEIPY